MPVEFADVQAEYGKYKDLKKEDVIAIMEWNKKQPHLPILTEREAIVFLQSCYFRMEPTKICIENYYTVKTHNPEVFQILKPSLIKDSLDSIMISVLPKPTPDGKIIFFGKLMDANPDLFLLPNAIAFAVMECLIKLAQIGTTCGQIIVLDATGFSIGHVMKVNLMFAKKMLFFLQEALPVRLKEIHIINAGPVIDKMFGLLKPFLGKEILSMLKISAKMDCLTFPVDILPNEYGGNIGTCKELADKTRKNLEENEAFFIEEMKKVVNESKRVGRSKYLDEVNGGGIEGSFKKLEVD